ncbi:MAG TPA: GNAT family N-acetyltransferase [Anaerolineales bacterium]|nr:GNAT family N-acetyltransferase [Anaerolineales bacterium]
MNELNHYHFRGFAGRSDYPKMAKLIQDISVADDAQIWTTAEDIERDYGHLVNSKPETDMLMVEDGKGDLAAYVRVDWDVDDERRQVFGFPFNLHPTARIPLLYSHLLEWVEKRSREVAAETKAASTSILRAFLRNVEKDAMLQSALEGQGFSPVRFMNRMSRDLNEPIEVPAMPEGLEVRPVPESHYRAVINALDEAFQDHWGHSPIRDADYQAWSSSPVFKPSLWQVAWDGDQIAAGVLNTVDEEVNKQFNIQRGMTDPIFTRRPWRKRGLARTLLMRSLQMFKDMGITEAMLGVDTQNPSGAFALYESCGFKPVMRSVIYEKNITA